MNEGTASPIRVLARLVIVYAGGCGLGFLLLVSAFQVGLFANIEILFYRGLILIALASLLTFAIIGVLLHRLRVPGLSLRDAFAAAILSLSLNLSFLVVVPVTVDRSISIFLLGEMAAHPDRAFTPDEASALFKAVYVDDDRQIDRRLREQAISGNIEGSGGAYKISQRGLFVIEIAKVTAKLFDSHAGLVEPRKSRAPSSFQETK